LQHAIDQAAEIDFKASVVILGANAVIIQKEINPKSFQVIVNDEWKQGMASSLRLGIEKVGNDVDAILIMVGDQPFVTKELLSEMVLLFQSSSDIVACQYVGINGVPVLLGKEYFEELLTLEGDTGARKIVQKHQGKVKSIQFEQGKFDIDTPEDLNRLSKKDQ